MQYIDYLEWIPCETCTSLSFTMLMIQGYNTEQITVFFKIVFLRWALVKLIQYTKQYSIYTFFLL